MHARWARFSRNLLRLITVAMVCLAMVPKAHTERFVFESHDGERPREADAVMQMLRQELRVTDFQADPAVLTKRLQDHAFSEGIAHAAYKPEVFEKDVTAGVDAWSNADFANAAQRLTAAIASARENPLMLAREPRSRAAMMRALLRTSLASKRQAEELLKKGSVRGLRPEQFNKLVADVLERRDAAMMELLRSFGEDAVTVEEYGAEAADLFREVRTKLRAGGSGQLLVTSNAKNLTLYLNERVMPGLAGTVISKMLPGEYRVLMQAPDHDTREYKVTVEPNTLARLDIQTIADGELVTGKWVGLSYGTQATEGVNVAALVSLQPQHSEVVTVRMLPQGHSVVVAGAKYEVPSGKLICRGSVALDRDVLVTKTNGDRLRQLVTFLRGRGDEPLHAVTVEQDNRDVMPVASSSKAGPQKRPLVEPAAPVAAAADDAAGDDAQENAPLRAAHSSHVGSKLLVAGGVATMIGGGVLLAIDEDPSKGGPVKPTYRETTLPGIVTLSAGAVLTGVGLWLWLRDDGSSAAATANRSLPIVAVGHDQVFLGWSGAF